MAPFRQVHAHHRISRLDKGKERRQIGIGTAVGLHIGMFRTEQLTGSLPGQFFHLVHEFAAPIIPVAGIPFRILVGEDRAHGFHHRGRYEVFRSNQLDLVPLSAQFFSDCGGNLRICLTQFLVVHLVSSSLLDRYGTGRGPPFYL